MTFGEYLTAAAVYWRDNRGQRMGQAYFNALSKYRPDLARAVVREENDGRDPFYNDKYIPAFLEWVGSNW